jgi:Flp pilus assembly protein TadD
MMSDDNDRDILGAGSQGPGTNHAADGGAEDDIIDVGEDHIESDAHYGRENTIDIEQELERALAEDSGEDIADEEISIVATRKKQPSGGASRFVAPVVVLVLAAGAAGFIVTHPDVIGRKAPAPVVASAPEAAAPSNIVLAEADTNSNTDASGAPAAEAPPPAPPVETIPPVPGAVPAPGAPDVTAAAPVPPEPAAEPESSTPSATAANGDAKDESAKEAANVNPAADGALKSDDTIRVAQADVPAVAAPDATPAAAPAAAPPALSAPADATVATPVPTTPPNDALTPPKPAAEPASADATQGGVRKDRDNYYDSNATLPTGQMANAVGPRKVNPSIEPGQKLIIVSGIRKSTDLESMIVAADRALKLGRYDAALEMYNTLYAKNPHDQRILMGRAVAQQNLGMNEQAIDTYEELLDLAPNNADAMVNMLGLLKQKDPAGAMARMRALEVKFPNHAGLAAQLGLAEGESGDYEDAMRDLGKAASIEPTNPQHPFNMAVLADRKGETATAIKYYELALQADSISSDSGQGIPRETVYDRLAVLRRR